MNEPKDFPLSEIGPACEQLIASGAFILQKWSCKGCGRRLSGQNVNFLAHQGHCRHCDHTTDLDQHGCNYAVIFSSRPVTVAELEQALGLAAPGTH